MGDVATDSCSLPQRGVEEDVKASLRFGADGRGFGVGDVFGEPLLEFFVVAPVAVRAKGHLRVRAWVLRAKSVERGAVGWGDLQFLSDNLLHDVAGHGVEDVEQGLVGEAGYFRLQRLHVLHGVAGWYGEVWLDGP